MADLNTDFVVTPDMTAEEIAAMQGGSDQGDLNQSSPQSGTSDAADYTAPSDGSQGDFQAELTPPDTRTTEGRIRAAERAAQEAQAKLTTFEANNSFLKSKADEAEAQARAMREQIEAKTAEAEKLRQQIEDSKIPTITQDERESLISLHGEEGAKPLIDMRNSMLRQEHTMRREIEALKKKQESIPSLVKGELDAVSASSAKAAFNAALMDKDNGEPDLGLLLKDQAFVDYLRSDFYGKAAPFNQALNSNDPSAVAFIRKTAQDYRASKGTMPTSSAGSRQTAGRASSGVPASREQKVDHWNNLLDQGRYADAKKYADEHRLMD